jgi:glycosyltransferase involved in cell wall biosynthesis
MRKLCYVANIPAAVHAFLRGHIQAASENYEVTLICSSVDKHLLAGLNARIIFFPIRRSPSPFNDIVSLFKIYRVFRHERFDIVHSHFPKTGLLAMLAARLAGVPTRINTFHGEVWVTRKGWRRVALKLADKLIGVLATDILVVSPSQRNFLVDERVLSSDKAKVIGAGSICGVDTYRFRADMNIRRVIRDSLRVSQDAIVILFMGRLNRDKGILDLAAAFNRIAQIDPLAVLLIVGTEEDVHFSHIQDICVSCRQRLHYKNFSTTPEHYMMAADIFCLPSYREGFGMTLIESAACGIPAVASNIYGITDAVEDKKTGLLFQVGNVPALTASLFELATRSDYRHEMGRAARERVIELFPSELIARQILEYYDGILEERKGKKF